MGILKASGFDRFVRAPDPEIAAILVHGSDAGSVRDHARALVQSIAGSVDDPFRVTQLSEPMLQQDPARLADEAQAIAFTGGRRAVWVRDAARAFTSCAEAWLAQPAGDSVVVAEAGSLQKSSKLRRLFEASPHALALACYEDGERDLQQLISQTLQQHGLKPEPDAREYLAQILGADRLLSRSELEKLCLYCAGQETVGLGDVEAVCGESAALSLDRLVDASLEGDLGQTVEQFRRQLEAATSPSRILSVLAGQLFLLQTLRSDLSRGGSAEQAVRSLKPPIFFKRQDSVIRQLRLWSEDALAAAARTVQAAQDNTRRWQALEAAVAERALIAIARAAQQRRHARQSR